MHSKSHFEDRGHAPALMAQQTRRKVADPFTREQIAGPGRTGPVRKPNGTVEYNEGHAGRKPGRKRTDPCHGRLAHVAEPRTRARTRANAYGLAGYGSGRSPVLCDASMGLRHVARGNGESQDRRGPKADAVGNSLADACLSLHRHTGSSRSCCFEGCRDFL